MSKGSRREDTGFELGMKMFRSSVKQSSCPVCHVSHVTDLVSHEKALYRRALHPAYDKMAFELYVTSFICR